MEDEQNLPVKTVTCNTAGCPNFGVPISLPCAEVVVCGICGIAITDVEET